MVTKHLLAFLKSTGALYFARKKNLKLKYPFNKRLTKQELKSVKLFWGGEFSCYKKSNICYEFYKHFGVVDSRLVANDVYAEAEKVLNPFRYSLFLQHKCCLKYLIPKEYRPQTIIQNINGHYMDNEDNIISKEEAIKIAKTYKAFFIKMSIDSGSGRGIMKVETNKDDIDEVFNTYAKDFICQVPLEEHYTLSRFNDSCINTIRVLSLNINDNCTILSSFIRMGGLGSIVDNLHASNGSGVLVGIKPDGTLHPFGVDKNYNKTYKSPIGLHFEGMQIENFHKVVEFTKYWHSKSFPFANLIGWDIIIDKSGKPIVIEINLDSADIAAHQIFNGPIFGSRTSEVVEYMKNNPRKKFLQL